MITPAHAFFNWAILRRWFRPWWVVAGSVLPDAPPFAAFFYLLAARGTPESGNGFFGFVMANGNPNRQPGFMEASFLLNSLPLYALAGALVLYWRREWLSSLWAGWGLHILADFLTHVEDSYAPLYSFFPDWTPRGLVSYWDPQYGAETFQVIQLSAAGLILLWIIGKGVWKRKALADRTNQSAGAPQDKFWDDENWRKGS